MVAGGEEIITTPEHPFYVPKKGWTSAAALRAGDQLVALNGELVIVEQVQHELLETPVKVYNFEVEDFHTYFVGDEPVLVHNTCKFTPDQQALLQLTKSKKHGVSMSDAEILVGWAKEYNMPGNSRIDMGHARGTNPVTRNPHLHIGPKGHIPIY